jgi:SAM-dependent methyltransferase
MILFGNKKNESYGDIQIKAEYGLHDFIFNLIINELGYGASILDLGAGEGALSQRLCDAGYLVHSVDKCYQSFKSNDSVFINVDFDNPVEVADFEHKYENYFDMVLSIEVIEHIENPWQYSKLIRNLAKPGGFIIVSTPNVSNWLSRIKYLFTGEFFSFTLADFYESGHISPISFLNLKLIFNDKYFDDCKILSACPIPFIWFTRNRPILFYTFIGFILRPFMRGLKYGWCSVLLCKKKVKH